MDRPFPQSRQDVLDVNPFRLVWIDMIARGVVPSQTEYYCPTDKMVLTVAKHFKTTAWDLRIKPGNAVIYAFLNLWSVHKIQEHGIKMLGSQIQHGTTKITIGKMIIVNQRTIYEIAGWLSTPSLNIVLERELNGHLNDQGENGFREAFDRHGLLRSAAGGSFTLPDLTTLAELNRSLGISAFRELALSEGDLIALVKICRSAKYSDILETTDHDGTIVHVIEVEDRSVGTGRGSLIFYTDVPLANFRKQLAAILENRKNPQGFKPSHDIFQKIVAGEIRGKELGRICISSKDLLARCTADDFAVFRQALRREFGIEWRPMLHGYRNARDLYGRMHTGYFFYYVGSSTAGYNSAGYGRRAGVVYVIPSPSDFPIAEDGEENGPTENSIFFYNRDHPELSFVRLSGGMPIGAGALIDSLGDRGMQFMDEVEATDPRQDPAEFESIEATFPGEGKSTFNRYSIYPK